jgi:hypothetical protein
MSMLTSFLHRRIRILSRSPSGVAPEEDAVEGRREAYCFRSFCYCLKVLPCGMVAVNL